VPDTSRSRRRTSNDDFVTGSLLRGGSAVAEGPRDAPCHGRRVVNEDGARCRQLAAVEQCDERSQKIGKIKEFGISL